MGRGTGKLSTSNRLNQLLTGGEYFILTDRVYLRDGTIIISPVYMVRDANIKSTTNRYYRSRKEVPT